MIQHIFSGDWHRKPPMVDGKSFENTVIDLHLYDVNTRNGWNLDESEPSAWDRWIPWAMAVMTLGVAVMGWLKGWLL